MANELNHAADILQRHLGKTVSIAKHELAIGSQTPYDVDYVNLHLEDISIRDSGYTDADDYVARQELILHGPGTISRGAEGSPLPQNVYEIPLRGRLVLRDTPSGLDIETDRAQYNIKFPSRKTPE